MIIHPTQKPQQLTDKLIKSCKPNFQFKVLIPFCGSESECISIIKNRGVFIEAYLYLKASKSTLFKKSVNDDNVNLVIFPSAQNKLNFIALKQERYAYQKQNHRRSRNRQPYRYIPVHPQSRNHLRTKIKCKSGDNTDYHSQHNS